MPIVQVDEDAYSAIAVELTLKMLPLSVRVEIRSTGCCDPSLGLRADDAEAGDLTENIRGLRIVIHPDVYALVGDITISHVDEPARKGFILTSARPLSEWSGFGVSDLRA